ncbi:hypothetical protein NG798_13380 [Ancylothrix sp. C2]|uniref:hypothetical protein n=1 Tax=Ancylothrix sp. D3o TaxID=2953691 RepID=UPI0021BB5A96|nr:hypothetical protein [Ancylothrix sp. D3o]MCT7950788.1 hypothetical protein [Ancylothrix sp. D3o]
MINDQEFLHGAAFLRLINSGESITILHASEIHPSVYLVEGSGKKSAILFKVSKKPTSAWSFTLSNTEELTFDKVHYEYPGFSVFLAFVCHKDGICCIALERLRTILEKDAVMNGQHISVSRRAHGSYHISGPGRQRLEQTVPQNDWPRVVISK